MQSFVVIDSRSSDFADIDRFHRIETSPLTQGFNHRSACDEIMFACSGQQPVLQLPEPAPFRGPREYCYYETFDARCSDDEVILMTSALYGRMRFGRCVKTNFGFMGCFTDVLDLLDRRCSGQRSCSVEVVEPTFDGVRPCNKELKCYLEVDYRCIRSRSYAHVPRVSVESINQSVSNSVVDIFV